MTEPRARQFNHFAPCLMMVPSHYLAGNRFQATSVRAVIRKEGLILVEWFSPKSISFLPGGTHELSESLEATLARELNEELSCNSARIGRYLGKIGHIWKTPTGPASCLNHFFEVALQDDLPVTARKNGCEMRWLDMDSTELNCLQPPSLRGLLPLGSDVCQEWNFLDAER